MTPGMHPEERGLKKKASSIQRTDQDIQTSGTRTKMKVLTTVLPQDEKERERP